MNWKTSHQKRETEHHHAALNANSTLDQTVQSQRPLTSVPTSILFSSLGLCTKDVSASVLLLKKILRNIYTNMSSKSKFRYF